MILNSRRRTQPDPQSCRIRSPGGRRGGPQKQTTHQETKTKLSSATPNRDKTSHCQRKHRKKHPASNVAAESAPHPRHVAKTCDNNTQTIPNNMVLWPNWQHAGFFLWSVPGAFRLVTTLRLTCGPAGNRTTTGSL